MTLASRAAAAADAAGRRAAAAAKRKAAVLRAWRLLVVRRLLPPLHGASVAFGAWSADVERTFRGAALLGAAHWRWRHETLRAAFTQLVPNRLAPQHETGAAQSRNEQDQPTAARELTSAIAHFAARPADIGLTSPLRPSPLQVRASPSAPLHQDRSFGACVEPPVMQIQESNASTAAPTPRREAERPPQQPSLPSTSTDRPLLQPAPFAAQSSEEDAAPRVHRVRQWQLAALGSKCWTLQARSRALRRWWLRTRAQSALARRISRHEAGYASRMARAVRRRAIYTWRTHCAALVRRGHILQSVSARLVSGTSRARCLRALARWSRRTAARAANVAGAACAVAAFEAHRCHRQRGLRRGLTSWSQWCRSREARPRRSRRAEAADESFDAAKEAVADDADPTEATGAPVGARPPADRKRLWDELRRLRAQIDDEQKERRAASFLERLQFAQLRQQHELLRRALASGPTLSSGEADALLAAGMASRSSARARQHAEHEEHDDGAASLQRRLHDEKMRHIGFVNELQRFARHMQL